MAGPFASTGNDAREIERVQLKGGYDANAGMAGVAAAVVGAAIPLITDAHADSIKADLIDETESIKEALMAAQNPALAGSAFKKEALENPVTAEAFKQYTLIQDAAASGKLPKQYALERLEAIQDEAIANNPGFEKEIRAAMIQATGVDPNKAIFQQMLNKSAADLSPEAKAERKVREKAAYHGITYEEQLQMNNVGARNQLMQDQLNLKKASGEYNMLDAGKEVNLNAGNIMLGITGEVNAAFTAGKINDEFIASMKMRLGTEVAAATLVLTQASSGVSGTQLTSMLAPLKLMEERVSKMLDDGSYQKAVTNRVFMAKLMVEDKVMSMPSMAAAWALGGHQGFGALIQYFSQAPTEASEAVYAAMSPKVRDAYMLRSIGAAVVMEQYGNMGTGVVPETAEQKAGMRVAAGLAIATDGLDEDVKATALQELRDLGEDYELSTFGSKKVAKATKNSRVLTAAFLNLQESNTIGLEREYAQLALSGSAKNISMENGQLVFETPNLSHGTKGASTAMAVNAEVSAFVARFNRMNAMSLLHSQTGTLPKSRYTNAVSYFDTIRGDSDKNAPKEAVVKHRVTGFGPDGKLVLMDGE